MHRRKRGLGELWCKVQRNMGQPPAGFRSFESFARSASHGFWQSNFWGVSRCKVRRLGCFKLLSTSSLCNGGIAGQDENTRKKHQCSLRAPLNFRMLQHQLPPRINRVLQRHTEFAIILHQRDADRLEQQQRPRLRFFCSPERRMSNSSGMLCMAGLRCTPVQLKSNVFNKEFDGEALIQPRLDKAQLRRHLCRSREPTFLF